MAPASGWPARNDMPGFGLVLIATLSFGVLAFGSVYPWAYWVVAVASAEMGLWAVILGRAWNDWRVWRLAGALAVVGVAIAVQLVPLPAAVISWVSPNAHAVLERYELGYAAREAGWHPISLAAWDTATALALFTAFALLLVGCVRALRYMNLMTLVSQLTILALIVGLVGILQKALASAENPLIYGFWRPQFQGDGFGPFVNRNHYAGWVVMVVPLIAARVFALSESLGGGHRDMAGAWRRWVASPEAGQAAFATAVVLVLGISVVLSGSRSGLVSLAVVVAVLGAFVAKRAGRWPTRFALALSVPVLLAAVMAWAGYDIAMRRFEQVPVEILDRVSVWTDTVRIIGDFPIAGVGVGAFSKAMAVYQTAPTHTLFVQAHNDYLQLMAEGGALVVLPVLVVLFLVGQGIWRRFSVGDDEPARFWLRAGALAGLAGIAVQSLVEFSLQKPGNTVLFIVLVALVLHRPSRGHSDDANRL
jgi:O-antigen ligase